MALIFAKSENKHLVGLSHVAVSLGEQAIEWDGSRASILDILKTNEISVVFVDDAATSPLLAKVHKSSKLVIVTQNQGDKSLCPDLVYATGQCANLAKFNPVKSSTNYYQSDILYLSNFPVNKRPYILNNLNELDRLQDFRIKICGTVKIQSPYYLGTTTLDDVNNLMGSTKLAIDFDGDMVLDYAANGIPCISSMTTPIYPSWINTQQVNNFVDAIAGCMTNSKSAKNAKKFVFTNKMTYHHKAADIFNKLGLVELEEKCLNYIKQRK